MQKKSVLKLDVWKAQILAEILSILFPEFKYFGINAVTGAITMKKHWYSIFSNYKTSFSELILSEIPQRLSIYRYGNTSQMIYYSNFFSNCMLKNTDHIVNILQSELTRVVPAALIVVETIDHDISIKDVLTCQHLKKVSKSLTSDTASLLKQYRNKNATGDSAEERSLIKKRPNNGDY